MQQQEDREHDGPAEKGDAVEASDGKHQVEDRLESPFSVRIVPPEGRVIQKLLVRDRSALHDLPPDGDVRPKSLVKIFVSIGRVARKRRVTATMFSSFGVRSHKRRDATPVAGAGSAIY